LAIRTRSCRVAGLWKLPELWTASLEVQPRSAAHKLLGRGSRSPIWGRRVHSYHRPLRREGFFARFHRGKVKGTP